MFTFTNNRIEDNGGTGIWGGANGTQTISHNEVLGNDGHGIHTRGNGTYTISENRIQSNSSRGVYGLYASHLIENNLIEDNRDGGIEIAQGGSYTILGNQVYNNVAANGVGLHTQAAWSPDVRAEGNTFDGNQCTDDRCSLITIFDPESGDPDFSLIDNDWSDNDVAYVLWTERGVDHSAITAIDNNWGTTDTDLIDAWIHDYYDDADLCLIDYRG